MDNRPIGFFDSGLGGLTSVHELHRQLPDEKVIYYGDTARTPYGSKSPETIRKFATQIVDYLVSKDVKMVIIACNTATSWTLDTLRETYPDIPILGVIGPTVRKVVSEGCTKVGVIATKATITSDVYGRSLKALNPDIEVHSLACPAIVPLVEEGFTGSEIMDLTVRHYMDDFVRDTGIQDLILGCTHYPLIADHIMNNYPGIRLYNSSAEVIGEAGKLLADRDMLAHDSDLQDRYYASDLSENFIAMTDLLFAGTDFRVKLKSLDD